jgi:hypothetical protein
MATLIASPLTMICVGFLWLLLLLLLLLLLMLLEACESHVSNL